MEEEPSSPCRDAKEFSTLLNACGRMDKASFGIGACLNDKRSKKKAIDTLAQYRSEIVDALRWYESGSGKVTRGKNYLIINAEDKVMPTIIGTLASIISKSGDLKKGTIILSLAQDYNGMSKASIRISGEDNGIDLREVINRITEKTGGESGGHKNAAGAGIPTETEKEFIEEAIRVFKEL